jgi:hypothetical protein
MVTKLIVMVSTPFWMRYPSATRWLCILCACSIATGCGSKPNNGYIPVTGTVVLDGAALTSGTVSFRPFEPPGWHQPTGMIAADGRYQMYTQGEPGAPPGRYKVVVFASSQAAPVAGSAAPGLPKLLVPVRYTLPDQTPLVVQVPSADSSEAAYRLELSHD